jgi:hypothetical protein
MIKRGCAEPGVQYCEVVWRQGGWITSLGKDWIINFKRRWHHKLKLRRPRALKRSRTAVSLKIVWEFFETLRPNSDYCVSSKLQNFPWRTMSNYKPMFTEDIWVDVTSHRIRRHWEVVRKLVLSRDVEGILAIFECVQQSRRASGWKPCQEIDEQVHRLEKRVGLEKTMDSVFRYLCMDTPVILFIITLS